MWPLLARHMLFPPHHGLHPMDAVPAIHLRAVLSRLTAPGDVGYAASHLHPTDDRVDSLSGAASDVWSLGCLLYELVTGRYLYADDDWIRMFVRVTKARMHTPQHSDLGTSSAIPCEESLTASLAGKRRAAARLRASVCARPF